MRNLEGAVAIITGAAHPIGMGQTSARKLADQGAIVVLTDLAGQDAAGDDRHAQLEEAASKIIASGGKAKAILVDITNADEIELCVDQVLPEYGRIDILFNNAGTAIGVGPFLEMGERAWSVSCDVHIKGTAMFSKAVIPHMIERNGGVIINNASLAGLGAISHMAAYTATKFAVVGLTKAIAAEFGDRNIRCNAICPGAIKTSMYEGEIDHIAKRENISREQAQRLLDAEAALMRAADPEEVAEVVAFLAGPGARYVTGVALPIAGGASAGL